MKPLTSERTAAYLARLGSPVVRNDAAGLAELQAAHLMAVPFHNLWLLANDGRPRALPAIDEVLEQAIAGVGGNCDWTTPPFVALLQELGFDAHLAAATVREPGDHFVCVAHTQGRRFLCDVGNGHPYLRPWELDGPIQEQEHHGWSFRFVPDAPDGPTLYRRMPDGSEKTVYTVSTARRAYEEFAPMVRSHYTSAGFGPFLTGLRAVRVTGDSVLTLRDTTYARDTRFGRSTRQVGGRDALRSLLTGRFELPSQLVDGALDVLGRRRPDLIETPRWFALGRGTLEDSQDAPLPSRDEVPDILISLATVGRHTAVDRLLRTLEQERVESGYPGRIGVLIVENHDPVAHPEHDGVDGIKVHRVPIDALRSGLERAARTGILPPLGDTLPVPIGAAREAQLVFLREHLDAPVAGLPHPATRPVVVWMLDDDMAFEQLGPDGRLGRHTNVLFRAARFWAELPQHSVVLGTFTGDPPVPCLDCLEGQLTDLCENMKQMVEQGPEAEWAPPRPPPPTYDAYYDLTEAEGAAADAVWPYAPERQGDPVRSVALGLLQDLPRLLDGQQLTRPLHWDGEEARVRPSLRRGGNTLFLDIDALFAWPTPLLTTADGVATRRSDTLWAALARMDDPDAVVEATLPLLHGREGQSRSPGSVCVARAARHTTAQVRGVVLSRALAEGRSVGAELRRREAQVSAHRQRLTSVLSALAALLQRLAAWGDPSVEEALDDALRTVEDLQRLAVAGNPLPGDPEELEAFLTQLPDAVRVWRGAW